MKRLHLLFTFIGIFILGISNNYAQNYPPSSVVTMPFSNAYFKAGTDVEIHVYSTDIGKSTNNGTVTKVEFLVDGNKIGETSTHTNNTYKFTWGCVPAGEYRITARSTNDRGVSFTSTGVLITVGNQDIPSQGLSVCKGKYLAGLHQYQVIGNWDPYFNGVSAENSCKWGSIEGTRDNMNWSGADNAYNYAADRNLMFRWHAAMWASQYPNWLFAPTLSTADARAELVEYMEGIATRYKYIDQIDVLNEQLFTHQGANQQMRDKFSGQSNTAIDDFGWQIWLFTEARRIFPNTKLVLNDYGLEGNNTAIDEMLKLVRVLRDRGLIDGFGTQAHWFSVDNQPDGRIYQDCSRMARGGVPVYVTELDMAGGNDNNNNEQQQLASFQNHFPEFWEHPDVKGVTFWGHVLNRTWVTGTGFTLENGQDRAAGAWLKNYMAGRQDVGYPMCPQNGCTNNGQISLALTSPSYLETFNTDDDITISATASDGDGNIVNVKFYDGNTLLNTDNTAPYSFVWTNPTVGEHTIRAVATDNEGFEAEVTVDITVFVPQTPYGGNLHPIPGTIQLEEYDVGGNGNAYYDDTEGSETGVNYRTDEDVDIENCTDTGGGYNVGWATSGEWLEYSVDVTTPGIYELEIRAACNGDDRTLSVSMDGEDIATNVAIPNTAGWQAWQTITVDDIELTEGEKIMRVSIGATDYINLNYVTFNLIEEFVQSPYNGTPHPIPGRIEAEEYDFGREGIGYHEANENGNQGNSDLRGDEVDIEVTGDVDGELNIAYTLTGEWLAYTVDVASTGLYDVDLRVAKDGAGGSLHIEFDGVNVTGAIAVPNTGAWQTYQTVTVNDINLTAGEHEMRIVFDTDYMNLNYVVFTAIIQDTDNDGTPDDEDACPNDPNKAATAGVCGCGVADTDSDADGIANCVDTYPNDADNDGITTTEDCDDNNAEIGPAITWYQDTDGDGVGVSNNTQTSCTKPTGYVATAGDECPNDINKTTPGNCGCGNTEESCLDCAGTPNGTAFLDNCDNCVATQQEACEQDCNGDWGGTAVIDACDECTGGNTGLPVITDPTKCVATGVDNYHENGLKVYPNPSTGMVHLPKTTQWILHNAQGEQVLEGNSETLNMSGLADGIYFLQFNGNMIKVIKE